MTSLAASGKRFFLLFLACLVFPLPAGLYGAEPDTAGQAAQPCTITRTVDPITVSFEKLAHWVGEKPGRFGLYKFEAGNPVPVPWQFDEVAPDGRLVLDRGSHPEKDLGARAERLQDLSGRFCHLRNN